MVPANCFNGAMENLPPSVPGRAWVGPKPPALATAEIVTLKRSTDTFTLTRAELQHFSNLAHCVRRSKQNVGLKMQDYADSALRVLNSKGL